MKGSYYHYYTALAFLCWAFAGVSLFVPFTAAQGVIFLEPDVCANWTEAKEAYDAAMSVWIEPNCYNYSYTFWGFQIGLPTPVNVTVRYGVAVNADEGGEDKTMQVFTDMIYDLCIANCPDEGAETCIVEYAPEGYPTRINIDMSRYIADETRSYTITNFLAFDCEAGSLVDGSLVDGSDQGGQEEEDATTPAVTNRCADLEQLIADMDQATKQWSNPDCYDFVYERMSSDPVEVQVRSGVAMNDEMTIIDYMSMIQTDCVDRCMEEDPENPMDYVCTVTFADGEGYPVVIDMDPIDEGTDGAIEDHVRILDLTVVDCESAASREPGAEEAPVTDETPATEDNSETNDDSSSTNGIASTSVASNRRYVH